MTARIAELKKKRAGLVAELRSTHEEAIKPETEGGEAREYTPEAKQEFERREAELDKLDEQIGREETIDQRERDDNTARAREIDADRAGNARNGAPRTARRLTAHAIQGWVRARRGLPITEDHEEAMSAFGIRTQQNEVELRILNTEELALVPRQIARSGRAGAEQRMSTSATEGAELIPEGFIPNWEIALLAISQMRNFVDVMRTASGNDLPWPTTDDSSNAGELLAEEAAAAEQDVATGSVIFQAYKYSSKIVKISAELLQDSAFNMTAMLGSLLGTRIARITNTHFTTGTGSAQPNGIVTAATQAFVMASASVIDPDEIVRMPYEIDPAYQSAPGAGWMIHNAIIKLIRLLRDDSGGAGTGQYLWKAGLAGGEPDTLAGYPICVNQDMASAVAVNAKIALFGDLKKYKIRDAGTIRLKHLVELYAANDQEGFIAFSRHDGDLLDAGTNPIKYLQMAAA